MTSRIAETRSATGRVRCTGTKARRHVSYRTSLVIDPPNGRIPPYTPEAEKRVVRKGTELGFVGGSFGKGPYDGPEDLALTDRCITRGLPQTWFPSEYNNGFQIVQSADT